jgi:hypothetical protein
MSTRLTFSECFRLSCRCGHEISSCLNWPQAEPVKYGHSILTVITTFLITSALLLQTQGPLTHFTLLRRYHFLWTVCQKANHKPVNPSSWLTGRTYDHPLSAMDMETPWSQSLNLKIATRSQNTLSAASHLQHSIMKSTWSTLKNPFTGQNATGFHKTDSAWGNGRCVVSFLWLTGCSPPLNARRL